MAKESTDDSSIVDVFGMLLVWFIIGFVGIVAGSIAFWLGWDIAMNLLGRR